MAHTDDIAEKVADLLLDQTARAANFGYDTGATLVKGAGVLTERGLKTLSERAKERAELQKLLSVEGEITPAQMDLLADRLGENSSTLKVSDTDVEDYETLLRQNGIMYAKMGIKDDNAKMFIFLNRDNDKVLKLNEALKAKRGSLSEVRPDVYFNSLAPENVRLVDGLDPAELALFRKYSRFEELLYTAIKRGEKYALVFSAEDVKKANKVLLHVAWDLTGHNGARNREQVEYHLAGHDSVHLSALDAQRELYIVSNRDPGHYFHITAEDVAIYKQHKKVSSIPRSAPDFLEKCRTMADSMAGAVILNEQQYDPALTAEDLAHYPTIDLHDPQYDILIEMETQNRLINLVAMKSGMDDEHNAHWGLWDPSVSYSEFAAYEYIMDSDEREARYAEFEHFRAAAFYGDDRFEVQDVHLDERNVDYIISKAEARRGNYYQEPSAQTPQQNRADNGDEKTV